MPSMTAGMYSFGIVPPTISFVTSTPILSPVLETAVACALHEDPGHIPTWYEAGDRRRIRDGLVFTIEPFLSLGANMAVDGDDEWTLFADGGQATVQYEHTLVATKRGAVVVTMA